MSSNRDLLAELEAWVAEQSQDPTLLDVAETGNVRLLGAFILKAFREAVERAVEERDRVAWAREQIIAALSGSETRAEMFLRTPHPLLAGETPLRKASRSAVDAQEVIALARLDITGAALRALDGIVKAWRLNATQEAKLMGADLTTVRRWRSDPPDQLPAESLVRLSLVLGIFKAINTLLPVADDADAWVHKANRAPLFGGHSALQVMLTGTEGLRQVRRYLDDQT